MIVQATSNLRILLLGTPTVYYGDSPIHIRRRIQRALLFYLAAQDDMASRAELAALFWPDDSDEEARRHLREALSKLRADLPAADLLIAAPDRVGLNPEKVSVDVREFSRLLQQVERTPWRIPVTAPLPSAVYQALVQAVRLWRAPIFMAGADLPASPTLDEWLARTAQYLQNARLRVLERLADHASVSGDPEGALNWLRAALEDDELNESLHERVLEILIALGRRAEALQVYNTLEERLRRELETTPSSAIQALRERILAGAPAPAAPAHNNWPVAWSMQVPFVGRAAALDSLKQVYYRGGLAVVLGEAGAGKSRLVQELYYSLRPAPRLLLAPARPQESTLPFQPLIAMFREAVRPEEWANLPPAWVSPLTVLLPELLFTRSNVAPVRPADPEQARALLFEAVHQVFASLAKDQPILLFLDDAQWADEATLAAMAYLIERSFFNEHALLVIAARPEEHNPDLERLLSSLHASSLFVHVPLDQLSLPEVADLARFILGQEPTPEFVHQLAKDTGGNPLFILETLRAVLEQALRPDLLRLPASLPLAGSIHTLVRSRLRALSQPAAQVLTAAALVGNAFDVELVEKANRMEPEQVVQALEELERARLVRPLPQAANRPLSVGYQFIHDKIREVVLLDLSPARLRFMHRRVAQALEETLGAQAGQQAAVLARHFEAGGDLSAAFRYWVQAAERARQLFSTQEASSSYRRAENLLTALGSPPSEAQFYRLYAGWGELAEENGDLETLDRVYSILRRLGEQLHSPLLLGTALSGLGSAAMLAHHTQDGLRYIEQAMLPLDESGDLFERVRANVRRGQALVALNQYPQAVTAYRSAIHLSEGSPQLSVRQACTDAHAHLAIALLRLGQPEVGRDHAETALRQSIWPPQSSSQVRIYQALANTHYDTGLFRPAATYSHQGIEVAEQTHSWHAAGHLHVAAARSDFLAGNLDESWAHLQMAVSLSERSGRSSILPEALCMNGDLFWFLGAYPRAAEFYQAGMQAGNNQYESMENCHRLGMILGFTGEIERGLELVAQAMEYARQAGAEKIRLAAEISRGVLLNARGEVEQAVQVFRSVESEAGGRRILPIQLIASIYAARCMLSRRQADEAHQAAHHLIGLSQALGSPWLELLGHRVAHAAGRQRGETGAGHLARARKVFDGLNARITLDPLRPAYEAYRQAVLAELQPGDHAQPTALAG